MLIKNLAGILTGAGFAKKLGRQPTYEDVGSVAGPVDILLDSSQQKILEIGKNLHAANSAEIDATGQIASAGFVDSHTHTIFAGTRAKEFFFRWEGLTYREIAEQGGGIHNTVRDTRESSDRDLLELTRARLQAMLQAGTTTVEIKCGYGGTPEEEIRQLRILKKLSPAEAIPEIKKTFLALHALPAGKHESDYVNEMIRVLPQIKNENLADYVDAFPEKSFFTREESLRFALAAQKMGFGFKIHADELSNLESTACFAAAGALSVDHLQHISDSGRLALQKSSTVATLLPATSFYLGLPYTDARSLITSGARVALATDYNPGTAPAHEMRLTMLLAATQFRMSAAEIFCGVTYNGAAALGLESTHGILQEGRIANILLWQPHSLASALEEIVLGLTPQRVLRATGVT